MSKYLIAHMNVIVLDIESADKVFVDILRLKKENGGKFSARYILNKDTHIVAYKVNKAMKNYPISIQLTTSTKNIIALKRRLENHKFFSNTSFALDNHLR